MTTPNEHFSSAFAGLERSPKPKAARDAPATRSLVIAMTPRSGSTMFCSLLEKTGALGLPDEYLNPVGPMQLHGRKLQRYDFDSYWDALLRKKRTANGIFSLKADFNHLRPLLERGPLEEFLPDAHFVYLERSDIVAQAVSLQRAASSGLWHLDRDRRPLRSVPHAEPVYDRAAIGAYLAEVTAMREQWREFFASRGITPLRLTYEGIVADPAAAVSACLSLCGAANANPADLSAETSKIGDALSDEWCRRYRMEQAEPEDSTA
jgi:LPS sulfotransferase NodH